MTQTVSSDFYCLKCVSKITLPRRMSRIREKGHLKAIYCYNCKERVNHFEVREFDVDFDIEKLKEDIKNGVYENSMPENQSS